MLIVMNKNPRVGSSLALFNEIIGKILWNGIGLPPKFRILFRPPATRKSTIYCVASFLSASLARKKARPLSLQPPPTGMPTNCPRAACIRSSASPPSSRCARSNWSADARPVVCPQPASARTRPANVRTPTCNRSPPAWSRRPRTSPPERKCTAKSAKRPEMEVILLAFIAIWKVQKRKQKR